MMKRLVIGVGMFLCGSVIGLIWNEADVRRRIENAKSVPRSGYEELLKTAQLDALQIKSAEAVMAENDGEIESLKMKLAEVRKAAQ